MTGQAQFNLVWLCCNPLWFQPSTDPGDPVYNWPGRTDYYQLDGLSLTPEAVTYDYRTVTLTVVRACAVIRLRWRYCAL